MIKATLRGVLSKTNVKKENIGEKKKGILKQTYGSNRCTDSIQKPRPIEVHYNTFLNFLYKKVLLEIHKMSKTKRTSSILPEGILAQFPRSRDFIPPSSNPHVLESDGAFAAGNLSRHLRVGDLRSVYCVRRTSPDTEEGAKDIQGRSSPLGNLAKKTRESEIFCRCSVFLLMLCMTQWPLK